MSNKTQNLATYLPLQTVKLRSAVALSHAVQQSPSLANLAERAQLSGQCLRVISPMLPAQMRSGVQAGALQDGQWCLLAANSAVATKLRHLSPSLLAHLRTHGHDVQDIRIKIAMRSI